jgi:hypothetical protein
MRFEEIFEGKARSIICVDVQPEYSGMNDGDEDPVFIDIVDFVLSQKCPVLMFVNAEDTGVSTDTVEDIQLYWENTAADLNKEIDWERFEIIDKGYGYLRAWMDYGPISDNTVIRTIREMYQQKVNDSRMLFDGDAEKFAAFIGDEFDEFMIDDAIMIKWVNVSKLKQYEGSIMVGGGRSECLREIELIMNAFNIRYKRANELVYGYGE